MTTLVILLIFMALVIVQRLIYQRFWNRGLTCDLHFSASVGTEGDEIELIETVASRKWLPLPWLTVKFQVARQLIFSDGIHGTVSDNYYREDLFSLLFYQQIRRRLPIRLSKRGYYTIHGIDLLSSDLLMTTRLVSHYESRSTLVVRPRQVPRELLEIPFRRLLGQLLSPPQLLEDPFEFRALREYQPYDSMRRINWKASARTGSLKSNVFESTTDRQAWILLNIEQDQAFVDPELVEEAIRVAATLISWMNEYGIRCGLLSNALQAPDRTPVLLRPGAGPQQERLAQELLGRIDLRQPARPFAQTVRDSLADIRVNTENSALIIISMNCHEDLIAGAEEWTSGMAGSLWIVPHYLDHNWRQPVTEIPVLPWEVRRIELR